MKKVLLGSIFMFIALMQFAQSGRDYTDVLELIVDEKYERALYKAEKYTLSDDTKKDALPYLYMAISYWEISKNDEFMEKYPKAFKESLKYAAKYRKKDKESEFYDEYSDFFSELRLATIAEADLHNMQEKYTKSKGLYKYLTQIDPYDAGAWIMKGYTEYMLKSKKDASLSFEEAKRIMNEDLCSGMADEQRSFLKDSIVMNAERLEGEGNRSEAVEWLELGKNYFGDDKDYMVTYRMIVG